MTPSYLSRNHEEAHRYVIKYGCLSPSLDGGGAAHEVFDRVIEVHGRPRIRRLKVSVWHGNVQRGWMTRVED